MHPKALRKHITVERVDDELVVLDTRTSNVHHLHPVTALVWYHADGTRSVQDLLDLVRAQEDGEADEEVVWMALDALADAGLLEERLAPPTGTQRLSRRNLMRRTAAIGLGVTTLPISPLLAQSAPGDQEQATKEQQAKADQEQTSKAEQESKQSSEQDQKQNAEQDWKQNTEQDQKQNAEQDSKQNAEQDSKQNAEQDSKQNAEQDSKQSSEEKSKRDAEQDSKQNAEQDQKQSQEEISKQR